MTNLPAELSSVSLYAYLRDADAVTKIYDVEVNALTVGRLVRRPDAPGWFASSEEGGVMRNYELEIMYYVEAQDALDALVSWVR